MKGRFYAKLTAKYEADKKAHREHLKNKYQECITKIDNYFEGTFDPYIVNAIEINDDNTASFSKDLCTYPTSKDIIEKLNQYINEKNNKEKIFDKINVSRHDYTNIHGNPLSKYYININIQFLDKDYFKEFNQKYRNRNDYNESDDLDDE